MKKFISAMLVLLLAFMMAGCDPWLSGSYSSVKPHEEFSDGKSRDFLEASTMSELQSILKEEITKGTESCVIYVTDMDNSRLENTMDMTVRLIKELDPIGAFAVEDISFEIGTRTGRTAIAVKILYNRSRSEILRIEKTRNMEEAMSVVAEAVEGCKTGVVVHVADYEEMDIAQRIQDYVDDHPDVCMEMPQVSAAVYPNSGDVRVMELVFTYQTNRDTLRAMQTYVQPVFRAAYLNVSGEEEESVKFSRMYAFLMERNDYQLETSITPAYSLLRHGVGDSKTFANVYAAMCTGAGLECHVISGTRTGEPWTWNLICEDGVYYHVDLIRSNSSGKLVRLSDEDMDGYVWDYSSYPAAEKQEKVTPKQSPAAETLEEKLPPEIAETVPETTESEATDVPQE